MKKRKPRHNRREQQPLRARPFAQLREEILPSIPTAPPQMPRMPSPPRSAREVLALLTAATGLVLAGQPDARIELLPGTPTTVLVTTSGKARAAFVLPVPRDEACRTLGCPPSQEPDPELDLLWAEEAATWKVDHAG